MAKNRRTNRNFKRRTRSSSVGRKRRTQRQITKKIAQKGGATYQELGTTHDFPKLDHARAEAFIKESPNTDPEKMNFLIYNHGGQNLILIYDKPPNSIKSYGLSPELEFDYGHNKLKLILEGDGYSIYKIDGSELSEFTGFNYVEYEKVSFQVKKDVKAAKQISSSNNGTFILIKNKKRGLNKKRKILIKVNERTTLEFEVKKDDAEFMFIFKHDGFSDISLGDGPKLPEINIRFSETVPLEGKIIKFIEGGVETELKLTEYKSVSSGGGRKRRTQRKRKNRKTRRTRKN